MTAEDFIIVSANHSVISNFKEYVVVIARGRVQYGKYFLSFSYFATYFTSL